MTLLIRRHHTRPETKPPEGGGGERGIWSLFAAKQAERGQRQFTEVLLVGGGGRTQSQRFAIMMQAWAIAGFHIAGGGEIVLGHHDAGMGDRGIAHRWGGRD